MIVNCTICAEDVNDTKIFTCKNKECNLACCIPCHQKYLIDSISNPHCMSCRSEISLDDFVKYFPKSWRLNKYKEHIKDILWSQEQSKMNETLAKIEQDVQVEEQRKLISFHNNKITDCQTNIYYITNRHIPRPAAGDDDTIIDKKKEPKINVYKYKCPDVECNGSLNNNYMCLICNVNYCKDCFEVITEETKDDHECKDEKKKTVTEIKKSSRPCSGCGEMIFKLSGCSQVFCVLCGTAFNWNTGEIEKGVIHNPHAARYFEANPEAQERYQNQLNNLRGVAVNNDQQNICNFTQYTLSSHLGKYRISNDIYEIFMLCWRNIYNYDNYNYNRIKISEPNNNDYRMKWLKKEIDETNFKKLCHMRYKKYQKNKMDNEIVIMTKTVLLDMLRDTVNYRSNTAITALMTNDIQKFVNYSNNELSAVGEYFNLKPRRITNTFSIL